jgi:hypothetical protein
LKKWLEKYNKIKKNVILERSLKTNSLNPKEKSQSFKEEPRCIICGAVGIVVNKFPRRGY